MTSLSKATKQSRIPVKTEDRWFDAIRSQLRNFDDKKERKEKPTGRRADKI
jgi:hypothetical protein